jgi:hypothetical protein
MELESSTVVAPYADWEGIEFDEEVDPIESIDLCFGHRKLLFHGDNETGL